jgi:hypothetical protein
MPRCFLLLFVLIGLVSPSAGQVTLEWVPAGGNTALPGSIRLYEAVDTELPLRAWYVRADLADTTWEVRTLLSTSSTGVETTGSFAARMEGMVAINGGYFGSGTSYSLVVDRGQRRSDNITQVTRSSVTYYPTRAAFGMTADRVPGTAWVYNVGGVQYAYPAPSPNTPTEAQPRPTAAFPEGGAPWDVFDALGGGPMLVREGEVRLTYNEEVFFGSGINGSTFQPRTAVGFTESGELLLLVVDGRQAASRGVTLHELAGILIDLGAVEAINLDGGGSSTMVAGGSLINRPEGGTFQRSVASALVLAPAEPPPPADEGIYFDNGDACCYREQGDGWSNSANTPYWGGTPSRIAPTGDGSRRATFLLEGSYQPGLYEVAAWWLPSFNRAKDTPYTIYSRGEGTTIRVDQTVGSTMGQWNVLGEFALTPGDSVVVSDDASGTTSPAYVSVDALRISPVTATSVSEIGNLERGSVSFHPNPTAGPVILDVEGAPAQQGKVFDVLGRVVIQFEARQGRMELDLSPLPPGVYFIRIGMDGTVRTAVVTVRR